MQDEPVGVTATQLPPSAEGEDRSSSSQPNQPDGQLSSFTPDHSLLTQRIAFTDFACERFCPTQSICDLQHSRNTRQQSGQHSEFIPAESPPPQGRFSHLQPFLQPEPVPAAGPLEAAEADAASPSPSPANLNEIQMDSPIAHHLNNGNGSSSSTGGNMLSGGLGAAFPNLPAQEIQSASGGSSSPSLPGFGPPWSVQTNSSPPPAANSISTIHPNALNQMPSADSENSFYPGIPSSINPAFFQSFSPLSANPCAGINVQGFSGPFSPQINVPQQPQSRRSPVSPQMHPQQGAFLQQRNNYNQHQGGAPPYLATLLNRHSPSHALCSSDQGLLAVPRSRCRTSGDRAFSVLAPSLWNQLPPSVMLSPSLPAFKSRLKNHLLRLAFPERV